MNVTEEMIEAALRKLQNNHRPISEAGKSVDERALVEEIITAALSVAPQVIDVDALAQEIRRVDGNHDKGASALAEALMPFLTARIMSALEGVPTVTTPAEKQDTPTPSSLVAVDCCPICAEPFKPDDLCASDIEMGTCHAACLEGSPVVDLDTGEEMPSGTVDTYPYSEVMEPSPQPTKEGDSHE